MTTPINPPEFLYLKDGLATHGKIEGATVYKRFPFKMHTFPTSFQNTVAFILHREAGKLLLGRKKNKKEWCFAGGFADPKDVDLETACARECQEEVGIDVECSRAEYMFSYRIDDPNYRTQQDKIMSAVFMRYYLWGTPKAGDDLAEVKWFTKDYVRRNYKKMLVPEQHEVVLGLINRGYL